ncbi:hypothetical protein SAMN05880590_1012 [Rhizobium sp. RU35A]|uniref:hypothetical protein n=1 Tax=Rhizobium sp. RU35A TaxID=1907414 RepID=UPI000953C1B3|nr:hypothetical protein [Rhizobium sp. RU35A]SIP88811.1 hypothetical protein SAMN05880590_1012 [Rhizobium sp. RU35A]
MSIESIIQEEARLTILKELAKQPNKALTSEAVRRFLLDFLLIDKPREWVEAQFQYLSDLSAVDVLPAGSVKIARLSERGELHLSGRICIAGIQRPGQV